MTDFVSEFLKSANIIQIIATGIIVWFFYARSDGKMERRFEYVDKKFDRIDERFQKIDEKFQKIDETFQKIEEKLVVACERLDRLEVKVEKLSEKQEDVDRRLCRIEGSLATHGHCLFSQQQPDRKAS